MENANGSTQYSTGFMNQVAAVWNSSTPTDVNVSLSTTCAYSEPLLGRHFYGTQVGCDCLRAEDVAGAGQFLLGQSCSQNQTFYDCETAKALAPIRQTFINERTVCGDSIGDSFLNVERPASNG